MLYDTMLNICLHLKTAACDVKRQAGDVAQTSYEFVLQTAIYQGSLFSIFVVSILDLRPATAKVQTAALKMSL